MTRATSLEIGGHCSTARALEAVGERWSLLIVREAVKGRTRFVEFGKTLRVSKAVLADGLERLVATGVLERGTYREPGHGVRRDCHLTQAGRDLMPVLAGLSTWGDTYMAGDAGPSTLWRHRGTGAHYASRSPTDMGDRSHTTSSRSCAVPVQGIQPTGDQHARHLP